MKFRIVGSIVVLAILAALVFVFEGQESAPQPRRNAPSSNSGSDPFMGLKAQ